MGLVYRIIGMAVAFYVAAYTLPDAIEVLANATRWGAMDVPAAVQTLGSTVVGIVAIVAFILLILKAGGGVKG